ncbi:CHAT domain-containing protein [Chamaesiphon minutus]|uniref:CHAT domain-containing protein n=1 Tax=Chamaesiphon minutus (strain ATCC 27169 / PCC 6605) TaxID=1173020 RepID=K9UQB1_CHAP6|nr:CHAT domain-containing protein [Chamaesiphon minutus]AFY97252.1 hypothetical protein Cha6605_6437 [Chamaesiphon minutus PCC 6605]
MEHIRDYNTLIRELLAGIAGGWSYGDVTGWLTSKSIKESELAQWFREQEVPLGTDADLRGQFEGLAGLGQGELAETAGQLIRSWESEIDDAETWFSRGYNLFGLGRYEEEIANYKQAIKIYPDYFQPWYYQGIALGYLGQTEESIASFERAIEIAPNFHAGWYGQGIELDNLGRFEDAVSNFNRAIEIEPNFYQAWFKRGFSLGNLNKFEEAVSNFNRAVEIEPNHSPSWHCRGLALGQIGRYEDAIYSFERAIEIDSDEPEIWRDRGFAQINLDRYEEAIFSYERYLNIQINDCNIWFLRGVLLKYIDKYEEAETSLDRAIQINPDFFEAWCERGLVCFFLARNQDSIASYDRAIELNADLHEAWFGKGLTLKTIGQYKNAIASYDRAIEIKPDYYEAWSNRGSALEAISKYKEAIANYDRAIEINPDFHLVWYNRGISLEHLGQYSEAIPNFERAIKLKPDDYQSLFRLGVALDNLGWYKEAIINLTLAIEIKPDFSDAWCSLGVVLENLGQYKEAIASYEQSIKLKPDNLYQVWANRGAAYGRFKGYQSQINAYYQALQEIQCNEHPDHWGFLYRDIGRRHYHEGNRDLENSEIYYNLALDGFYQILKTPACKKFPRLLLDVFIDISKVYLVQENVEAASHYHNQAFDIFTKLLNEKPTFEAKKYLQLEYYQLRRFDVDYFIIKNDPIRALEVAELDKNNCLTWLLSSLEENTISPKHAEMRQLLARSSATEQTAIIYWHYSPDTLTTFILTTGDIQPLIWKSHRATAAKQLEEWIEEWDKQYRNYGSKKDEGGKEDRSHHPWRINLAANLTQLQEILEIDGICAQLPSTLTHLILIPHGDLHRFPLHTLFLNSTKLLRLQSCTYLPSIQIGLNLQQRSTSTKSYTPLLSVEDPETHQDAMPFAQIESTIVRHLLQNHTHINSKSANLATVKNALKQPHASFHFTGHAAYNSRTPEASALSLTDEPLTAKQISQLNLSSYNLITLAACETAISGREKIDIEYVGLTSAFLQAGAANILSTLWQVDEIANAWFTIFFCQQLLAGKSPAVALTLTQRWMQSLTWRKLADWLAQLSQIPDLEIGIIDRLNARITNTLNAGGTIDLNQPTKYSHPYYWAAFTLTGEG